MASLDLNIFYSRGGFSINIKIKNSFQELTYFASDGFVVEIKGGSCLTVQLNESSIGLLNPPKSDKKMH